MNKFSDTIRLAENAIKEIVEGIEGEYPNIAITGIGIKKIDVTHMGSSKPEYLTRVTLEIDSPEELE